MENQPLVSIITPCYNGEKFIDRYFKSILNQTYSHIELIFVNDGSIDQTEKIALTYKEKFEKCGCVFHYIFQENQGQAAAINRGLEIFQGEYLIWPDSDDWLEPDSIEKRVAFLEANTEYGFVRSNGYFCKIKDHRVISKRIISDNNNRFKKNIFDDLIDETTFCCCGCYMIRKNSFLNVNPERKILENKGGQNWQIEIPIAYNYKCGYIDKPLYNIFERESSHSRKKILLRKR
ncbi:glycosyl transferase GT2 family [Eubacterium limosum]|nr:glycosyl transferase GT2 family [Eubacterium limosum]